MDEKTMSFNENQLKRVGMAEAFTPELKKKMEEGVPMIQQVFKKEYDGDKVEATLHLKKSSTTDHYFLNKFDLALQKEGQEKEVRQTFYLNSVKPANGSEDDKQKVESKYTLKEAYNLLSGRPVHKQLVSKEGNEYEAWVKLDTNNKLENGNHKLQQFNQGYGFDLKSTLLQYSISEMRTDTYLQRLMESLQRGNLQKVTFFAKDGNSEKLYISPNIKLSALDVYGEDKKRIPLSALVDKDYISEKLSTQIKQRTAVEQNQERVAPGLPNDEKKQIQSEGKVIKHEQPKKQRIK